MTTSNLRYVRTLLHFLLVSEWNQSTETCTSVLPWVYSFGGVRTDTFGTGGSDLPCVCATCVFVLTHWSGTLWRIVKHVSIITAYQKPVNNNVSGVNDLSINVKSVYHCPSWHARPITHKSILHFFIHALPSIATLMCGSSLSGSVVMWLCGLWHQKQGFPRQTGLSGDPRLSTATSPGPREAWSSHLQDWPRKTTGGVLRVLPTSLHVFCALGEGLWPVPSGFLSRVLQVYGVPDPMQRAIRSL